MDLFDMIIGGKLLGGGGGSAPVVEPLSVTDNGVYTAPSGVDGYSPVTVDVQSGGSGGLIDLITTKDLGYVEAPATGSQSIEGGTITLPLSALTDYEVLVFACTRSDAPEPSTSTGANVGTLSFAMCYLDDANKSLPVKNGARANTATLNYCKTLSGKYISYASTYSYGVYLTNITVSEDSCIFPMSARNNGSYTGVIKGNYMVYVYGIKSDILA